MLRLKALCVGIDEYCNYESLNHCTTDAKEVADLLKTNEDGSRNFAVHCYLADTKTGSITNSELESSIKQLFDGDADIALFYFAGHSSLKDGMGYLLTSDSNSESDGVSFSTLHELASASHARDVVIILDCCYAGNVGCSDTTTGFATLREGMTIITACSRADSAEEGNTHGVFTGLLIDALRGGAMNLLGEVTPGSIYAYVDQALGPWNQRPMFKSNVQNFISLRKNKPPITLQDLHRITELFPSPDAEFRLDATYEPTEKVHLSEHEEKFAILQKYNRVNLLVPVGAEHMYFAAIENKSCKLTALGKYYWKLVAGNII